MKPGDSARPAASISCAPFSAMSPTRAMRSPLTATLAFTGGAPLPSKTAALRITRSKPLIARLLFFDLQPEDSAVETLAGKDRIALRFGGARNVAGTARIVEDQFKDLP